MALQKELAGADARHIASTQSMQTSFKARLDARDAQHARLQKQLATSTYETKECTEQFREVSTLNLPAGSGIYVS